MTSQRNSIAIVGLGPRGVSIIERLAAAATAGTPLDIDLHLIDDSDHGAGRVWDRNQTKILCMNTLADAVTLFTEPRSTVGLPVVEGPTLFEWVRWIRNERDLPAEKAQPLLEFPPAETVAADYPEELAAMRPESNPSRALYGEYIRWCFDVARTRLPETVQVTQHSARLTSITGHDDHDMLALSNGESLIAHATVLATGWVRPAPNAQEVSLSQASGNWVRPDNPVDQDISQVPAGEKVLVRGLGMGFFDFMALVTLGRGGSFTQDDSARSGLVYHPSGEEPHLVVASGRGYPYLPKSEYGSLPPKAKIPHLKQVIASLQDRKGKGSIDFANEVWPAIQADAKEAYGSDDFDLSPYVDPLGDFTGTPEELTAYIASSMTTDIKEAVSAWDSPLKAALWTISASRKPASVLGQQGRYTPDPLYNTFMALGQMVGSGPPLFRTRELLALVDAGLVTFLGAYPTIAIEGDQFVMESATTNTRVASSTLVDAWMHSPDIRRPGDDLTKSLLHDDRIRPFADSTGAPTNSPEVDAKTRRVVNEAGDLDPRLHLIGIPTSGQYADTTISPMPKTNPLMLQETDATARDLIACLQARSEAE